jgi:hypothetical protein
VSSMVTGGRGPTDSPQYLARFKTGEYIFQEGERGSEMFIVQEGKVEILKKLGGAERRLAMLEEGDFFGEMAILEDLPRSASARAATDCALLRIDSTTFDQMVRHHPEIPVRMLRKLSSRLREASPHLDVDAPSGTIQRPPGTLATPPAAVKPARAAAKTNTASARPAAPAAEPARPAATAGPVHPHFVHEPSGAEFPLAEGEETFVGRFDATTGFQPEIDLRDVDTDRSTSRRHARLSRRDARYFLREEIGTANGTFVRGGRIGTGVEVELADGDEVRFGRVAMVFHTS